VAASHVKRRCSLTLVVAALIAGPSLAADDVGGELRLRRDARNANTHGPLAEANRLAPGTAETTVSASVAEAELRGRWRMLSGNVLLSSERSRANELYASGDFGAWQMSAGKKIVGWDVGHGFRPNDFVQQEARRTLLALTPEGRPLLQLEHFKVESATSLIWVNPQRVGDSDDAQRFARESALAARWYTRAGAADWHLFARVGQHTGASLGAALAWVASDAIELHASARVLQRHDGWRFDPAAGAPAMSNPWQVATLGGTSQWLVGASWSGAHRQSVIVEAWHDGTALADAAWDSWGARNAALAMPGSPAGLPPPLLRGVAGNLAWQASPFAAGNLRRDNVFVRVAWQPDHWLFTFDALVTPADRGRVVTAGAQWQGDRLRINAAWRAYGGPANSLVALLPLRRSAVLSASWAF